MKVQQGTVISVYLILNSLYATNMCQFLMINFMTISSPLAFRLIRPGPGDDEARFFHTMILESPGKQAIT